MTDTPAELPKPNDVLASQITDALVAEGLILRTHQAALLAKLKSGGVRQEDWNLWVDMATAPPNEPGEAEDE